MIITYRGLICAFKSGITNVAGKETHFKTCQQKTLKTTKNKVKRLFLFLKLSLLFHFSFFFSWRCIAASYWFPFMFTIL